MISKRWPLFGLRLRTPRLELRLPDLDDVAALADVAAAGVHEPERMPFAVPWTDGSPDDAALSTIQWNWHKWASWSPENWSLNLVVLAEGRVIGTQAIDARQFAVLREVGTGSWLGREFQGRGYGTEMRAAVLDLAFAGLGAQYVTSEAFVDNEASYRVSRKLGYRDDGIERLVVRGVPVVGRRLRVDRAGWTDARTVDVRTEGLEPCLPLFGLREPAL